MMVQWWFKWEFWTVQADEEKTIDMVTQRGYSCQPWMVQGEQEKRIFLMAQRKFSWDLERYTRMRTLLSWWFSDDSSDSLEWFRRMRRKRFCHWFSDDLLKNHKLHRLRRRWLSWWFSDDSVESLERYRQRRRWRLFNDSVECIKQYR